MIGLRKTKAGTVQQNPAEGLCAPLQAQGIIQWKPSNIQGRFQQLEGETHDPVVEFVQLLGAPSSHPKIQPNTGYPSGRALSHEEAPRTAQGSNNPHQHYRTAQAGRGSETTESNEVTVLMGLWYFKAPCCSDKGIQAWECPCRWRCL